MDDELRPVGRRHIKPEDKTVADHIFSYFVNFPVEERMKLTASTTVIPKTDDYLRLKVNTEDLVDTFMKKLCSGQVWKHLIEDNDEKDQPILKYFEKGVVKGKENIIGDRWIVKSPVLYEAFRTVMTNEGVTDKDMTSSKAFYNAIMESIPTWRNSRAYYKVLPEGCEVKPVLKSRTSARRTRGPPGDL